MRAETQGTSATPPPTLQRALSVACNDDFDKRTNSGAFMDPYATVDAHWSTDASNFTAHGNSMHLSQPASYVTNNHTPAPLAQHIRASGTTTASPLHHGRLCSAHYNTNNNNHGSIHAHPARDTSHAPQPLHRGHSCSFGGSSFVRTETQQAHSASGFAIPSNVVANHTERLGLCNTNEHDETSTNDNSNVTNVHPVLPAQPRAQKANTSLSVLMHDLLNGLHDTSQKDHSLPDMLSCWASGRKEHATTTDVQDTTSCTLPSATHSTNEQQQQQDLLLQQNLLHYQRQKHESDSMTKSKASASLKSSAVPNSDMEYVLANDTNFILAKDPRSMRIVQISKYAATNLSSKSSFKCALCNVTLHFQYTKTICAQDRAAAAPIPCDCENEHGDDAIFAQATSCMEAPMMSKIDWEAECLALHRHQEHRELLWAHPSGAYTQEAAADGTGKTIKTQSSHTLNKDERCAQDYALGVVVRNFATRSDLGPRAFGVIQRASAQLNEMIYRSNLCKQNYNAFLFGSSVYMGIWNGVGDADFAVCHIAPSHSSSSSSTSASCASTPGAYADNAHHSTAAAKVAEIEQHKTGAKTRLMSRVLSMLKHYGFMYDELEPLFHARVPVIRRKARYDYRNSNEERSCRVTLTFNNYYSAKVFRRNWNCSYVKQIMSYYDRTNNSDAYDMSSISKEDNCNMHEPICSSLHSSSASATGCVVTAPESTPAQHIYYYQHQSPHPSDPYRVTKDAMTDTIEFRNAMDAVRFFGLAQTDGRIAWAKSHPLPDIFYISFDLTFQQLGVRNSWLLRAYLSQSCVFRAGNEFLKKWSKMSGMNNSRKGYLTSYAVTLLWIYYLLRCGAATFVDPQSIPSTPARKQLVVTHMPIWEPAYQPACKNSKPHTSAHGSEEEKEATALASCAAHNREGVERGMTCMLGQHIRGFFNFYAHFDWNNEVVSLCQNCFSHAPLDSSSETGTNSHIDRLTATPSLLRPDHLRWERCNEKVSSRFKDCIFYRICIQDVYELNLNLGRHLTQDKARWLMSSFDYAAHCTHAQYHSDSENDEERRATDTTTTTMHNNIYDDIKGDIAASNDMEDTHVNKSTTCEPKVSIITDCTDTAHAGRTVGVRSCPSDIDTTTLFGGSHVKDGQQITQTTPHISHTNETEQSRGVAHPGRFRCRAEHAVSLLLTDQIDCAEVVMRVTLSQLLVQHGGCMSVKEVRAALFVKSPRLMRTFLMQNRLSDLWFNRNESWKENEARAEIEENDRSMGKRGGTNEESEQEAMAAFRALPWRLVCRIRQHHRGRTIKPNTDLPSSQSTHHSRKEHADTRTDDSPNKGALCNDDDSMDNESEDDENHRMVCLCSLNTVSYDSSCKHTDAQWQHCLAQHAALVTTVRSDAQSRCSGYQIPHPEEYNINWVRALFYRVADFRVFASYAARAVYFRHLHGVACAMREYEHGVCNGDRDVDCELAIERPNNQSNNLFDSDLVEHTTHSELMQRLLIRIVCHTRSGEGLSAAVVLSILCDRQPVYVCDNGSSDGVSSSENSPQKQAKPRFSSTDYLKVYLDLANEA